MINIYYQRKLKQILLVSLGLLLCVHVSATDFSNMPKKQFNALLFTKTTQWHHKSIPAGVAAIQKLSEDHHFNLVWHEESRYFNDDFLKAVDVVIFMSTTGDVLNDKQQEALQKFVRRGKGFVGIHSASDTELDWPWFSQLIGRKFIIHPEVQTATLHTLDKNFPGLSLFPNKMLFTDEWYDFGPELTSNLKYLLKVDENTYNTKSDWGRKKGNGMGKFHPISWHQEFDGGRSFYTALGHTKATYSNDLFLQHVYGGIYWAATGGEL